MPYEGGFAKASVTANGMEFTVTGKDELADQMAATFANERVRIEGNIKVHRWQTRGKDVRETWEIQAATWSRMPGRSSA